MTRASRRCAATNAAFTKVGGHTFKIALEASGTNAAVELVGVCKDCHGDIESFDFARQDYDGDGVVDGVEVLLFVVAHPCRDELRANASGDSAKTVAARRLVAARLTDPEIVKKLFDEIAPKYAERPGGYTTIRKLGRRVGDAAPIALLQLFEE